MHRYESHVYKYKNRNATLYCLNNCDILEMAVIKAHVQIRLEKANTSECFVINREKN